VCGVVHAGHVESGLGEQVRVPALAARAIEDRGTVRQFEELDQARDLGPIDRLLEQRLELEQVTLVEVRRPPGAVGRAQKNTGSR
jgi:hypothetical protein